MCLAGATFAQAVEPHARRLDCFAPLLMTVECKLRSPSVSGHISRRIFDACRLIQTCYQAVEAPVAEPVDAADSDQRNLSALAETPGVELLKVGEGLAANPEPSPATGRCRD